MFPAGARSAWSGGPTPTGPRRPGPSPSSRPATSAPGAATP